MAKDSVMVHTSYIDVILWLFVIVLNLVIVILAWVAYYRYSGFKKTFDINKSAISNLAQDKDNLLDQIAQLKETAAHLMAQNQNYQAQHKELKVLRHKTETQKKNYQRQRTLLERLEKEIKSQKEIVNKLIAVRDQLENEILDLKKNRKSK
jgi:preprotein translocase subunit SecF